MQLIDRKKLLFPPTNNVLFGP